MPGKAAATARASLEKRSTKVLRSLAALETPVGIVELLGPRVSKRHPFEAYQAAARDLLAEREAAGARRRGEPLLSDAEQTALGIAGSRLLGLSSGGSPLAALSDEALESVRLERDPGRLAERLGVLDPGGNWGGVPAMGLLRGLVLVAVSAEAERRWRIRERENLARARSRRPGG